MMSEFNGNISNYLRRRYVIVEIMFSRFQEGIRFFRVFCIKRYLLNRMCTTPSIQTVGPFFTLLLQHKL